MRQEYKELNTREDVAEWFNRLFKAGLNFHPDEPASAYVEWDTGEPTYKTARDRKAFDAMMDKAFELLGDEVYRVGLEAFGRHGLGHGSAAFGGKR